MKRESERERGRVIEKQSERKKEYKIYLEDYRIIVNPTTNLFGMN